MQKYGFLIQLKEKVLAPVKKMTRGMDGFTQTVAKSRKNLDRLPRSITQLENKLHGLKTLQKESFSVKEIRDYQREINKTKKSIDKLSDAPMGIRGKFQKMNAQLGGLPVAMAGAFAVDRVASFGMEVTNTLAEFEKFEAVLTNTLGSKSAANKALQQINDFASTTPFQVDELTDSFIKMTNMGFQPSLQEMTKLGDLASSTGKDFGQLAEAVIDAGQFEFERLKEFGIRASKEGDRIKFTFKNKTTEVKASEDAIRQYVLGLGELNGVQGAMQAISQTTGGQLSNLQDKFTQLKLQIGQGLKPVISASIDLFSVLIDRMSSLVVWVKANSDQVKKWSKIILGVTGTVVGLWTAIKVYQGISGIFITVITTFRNLAGVLKLAQGAQLLLNLAMSANPIGLVIVAVAGLVAIIAKLTGSWETLKNAMLAPFRMLLNFRDNIIAGFKERLMRFENWFKNTFENVYGYIKPVIDAMKWLAEKAGSIVGGIKSGVQKVGEAVGLADKQLTQEGMQRYRDFAKKVQDFAQLQKEKQDPVLRNVRQKSWYGGIGLNPIKPKSKDNKRTTTNQSTPIKDRVTSITGKERNIRNYNITMDSLVKEFQVITNNLKESPQQVREMILQALQKGVNDLNYGT